VSGDNTVRAPRISPVAEDAAESTIERLHDEDWHSGVRVRSADWTGSDADMVTIELATLATVDFSGSRLERLRLVDVVLQGCDLSNLVLVEPSMVRVELRDCRVTGLALQGGRLEDVRLQSCRGEAFAMTRTKAIRFGMDDCQLLEADFREAVFEHLDINGTELRASEWIHAKVSEGRVRTSDLDGLKGASGLGGCRVDGVTLLSAASGLAAALGIRVDD
jgi:uncharacterized protein YjbI with pentapeptide repeats